MFGSLQGLVWGVGVTRIVVKFDVYIVFYMAEYMHTFHSEFRCVCKIGKKTAIIFVISRSVLPLHMEQLDSHWTYFYEMRYSCTFGKCIKKIQVLLQSDKNNG